MMRGLLSEEQNNRLEAVELERTLNHMMDAVYCPRCSTISLEDKDNCAQCSKCFFVFCSLCNESWHPGTVCLSAQDKLELMRRRMEGSKSGEQEFRKREAELQSLAHIQVAFIRAAEWIASCCALLFHTGWCLRVSAASAHICTFKLDVMLHSQHCSVNHYPAAMCKYIL